MRTCYVASDLTYPPREGLHQQTLLLVQSLRRSGVDVDLHTFCRSEPDLDRDRLEADLGIRLASDPIMYRGSSLRLGLRILARVSVPQAATVRALRRRIQRDYDVVHLEHVACSLFDRRRARNTIVSFVDPGSRRQWRLARQARAPRGKIKLLLASVGFTLLELSVRSKATLWHVVSTSDAQYLRRRYRMDNVVAIPILLPESARPQCHGRRVGDAPTVLVPVDLRHAHMREATAALGVAVGRASGAELGRCRFVVLSRIDPDEAVRAAWEGTDVVFVPWVEDFSAEIVRSDVVVLPDRAGTGLKTRALEALAHGKPIVGTTVVFEGLDVTHGLHALVADDEWQIVRSLQRLLTEPALAAHLGSHAPAASRHSADRSRARASWRAVYRGVSSCVAEGDH